MTTRQDTQQTLIPEADYQAFRRDLNTRGGSVVTSCPDFRGSVHVTYVEEVPA